MIGKPWKTRQHQETLQDPTPTDPFDPRQEPVQRNDMKWPQWTRQRWQDSEETIETVPDQDGLAAEAEHALEHSGTYQQHGRCHVQQTASAVEAMGGASCSSCRAAETRQLQNAGRADPCNIFEIHFEIF